MSERTLVILKPCTIQRSLIGDVINRFEKKGLLLSGMKMIWLSEEVVTEHYAHLKDKPFFLRIKNAMTSCPVIVCCWKGKNAVQVVRLITGFNQWMCSIAGYNQRRLQHECAGKYCSRIGFAGNGGN